MAMALYRGIIMSLDERRARHRLLAGTVYEHDVESWREDFLSTLSNASVEAHQ
jgi:trehalose-6-phosphate synthase